MDAKNQRKIVADLQAQLASQNKALEAMERACTHSWSDPMSDHIYTPSWTIPGDPPGTCGIDWRGPVYVPAETKYRWKRICSKCGKIEHTTRTMEQVTKTPAF